MLYPSWAELYLWLVYREREGALLGKIPLFNFYIILCNDLTRPINGRTRSTISLHSVFKEKGEEVVGGIGIIRA